MGPRVYRVSVVGEVSHRHEADAILSAPGSAVLVRRGVLRSLVMKCPDSCGDTLTINLDRRAGPAWRMYRNRHGLSLFPSVWRDSGCKSHFILWRSQLFWCDYDDPELDEQDPHLEQRVFDSLGASLIHYTDLADTLGEIPWSVLIACRHLVRQGKAEEGTVKQKGMFRSLRSP